MNTTSVEVTAGMGGFLVVFGLMIVVWLLGRDMTRRLRRMRLAEENRVEAVLRERAGRAEHAEGVQDAQAARQDGTARRDSDDGTERDGPDPIG